MEADVFSRLFTKVVMLAAVAGLASCALEDRVVFVPDSGAGGAQPDTATGADGSDAALAAPGDPPPDQRAVVPPGNWSTEPNREVRNLHMTWQQDPATTVTVQWATNDISLTDYEPRVWAMPSSRVGGRRGRGHAVVGELRVRRRGHDLPRGAGRHRDRRPRTSSSGPWS
jgi:hypothetical protein